jgi:hypothetical protein
VTGRKLFNTEEERQANKKIYMQKYRQDNKAKLSLIGKLKQRKTRALNKIKAVEYLGGECKHCGLRTTHLSVYDFHHLDMTDKESDPGSLLHYSWERIEKEIKKCILLCANCHRIEHEKDFNEL